MREHAYSRLTFPSENPLQQVLPHADFQKTVGRGGIDNMERLWRPCLLHKEGGSIDCVSSPLLAYSCCGLAYLCGHLVVSFDSAGHLFYWFVPGALLSRVCWFHVGLIFCASGRFRPVRSVLLHCLLLVCLSVWQHQFFSKMYQPAQNPTLVNQLGD